MMNPMPSDFEWAFLVGQWFKRVVLGRTEMVRVPRGCGSRVFCPPIEPSQWAGKQFVCGNHEVCQLTYALSGSMSATGRPERAINCVEGR